MMDTVWMRLTLLPTAESVAMPDHFMFGPTGVVRFTTVGGKTILSNSAKVVVAEVSETDEFIMNVLRKMRGTEGRLDGKKSGKAARSKRKASSRKESR